MKSLLLMSVPSLALLILCGDCFGEEKSAVTSKPKKESPAAGGRLEVELLRAPAAVVARVLLEGGDGARDDAARRERLLAKGATVVARSSVTGPYGKDLKFGEMKTIAEPALFEYAAHWQIQGREKKEGKELSPLEKDVSANIHEEGCTLTAMLDVRDEGTRARMQFKWAGAPVVRTANSWPVKDRIAKIIQDRVWTADLQWTGTGSGYRLLAAAPEPPGADGNFTGFVYVAFGKMPGSVRKADAAGPSPRRMTQCWTFEMPGEVARTWLADRKGAAGDEQKLRSLLSENEGAKTALLNGVYGLGHDHKENVEGTGRVHSGLEWEEPIGFEPPDTRAVRFVPVPNDADRRSVAYQFATDYDANLTMPATGVKWVRWHGATRGAVDEPTGVESSATGLGEFRFPLERTPGRVFLANVHSFGAKARLTFARTFFPKKALSPACEIAIQILETPADPWLTRLAGGGSMESFIPELKNALTNGGAEVIHTEFCTLTLSWKRGDTWPWMAIAPDYLNPSIHDGRFCYNPRSITGSSPACQMEAENLGAFHATVCGEPVSQRLGLWLPDTPGYTSENSHISLSSWPQFTMAINALLPRDRDLLLHASLGRSWSNPEKTALHWLLYRRMKLPDGAGDYGAPPAELPPEASFTITSANGAVLTHVTLPAVSASVGDGRMLQTVEPGGEKSFQDAVPKEPQEGRKTMDGQPDIASMLDGIEVNVSEGKWTLKHSPAPARRITETLTAMTEQPAGDNYESKPVSVSVERLVMQRETLTGTLPARGASATQALEGGRTLTVRVR
ncbi:MAG TPA: hypothetical protein VG796_13670 [Verrucomicrobiales bacterium]|nr:hypothetical protein [Verrucomicrobiales bacterium]